MVLTMARPFKHPKTGVYWFRRAVPADLRGKVGKREVSRTLKTKDPAEARKRHAEVAAEVERHWTALRSGPVALTQRDITALAGTIYQDFIRAASDEPGSSDTWRHVQTLEKQAREDPGALERWQEPLVDEVLAKQGLHIDEARRLRLLTAFSEAVEQAGEALTRNAAGDYSPDPRASRFPPWSAPQPAKEAPPAREGSDRLNFRAILEDWWREGKAAGLKPSTYESYSGTVANFVRFLGHDDAVRVSPEDVIAFKDNRLSTINPKNGKAISPRTIKHNDLAALNTIFNWAVTNRRLSSNPAAGVTIKVGKQRRTRSPGFDDGEAVALLKAADELRQGRDIPRPSPRSVGCRGCALIPGRGSER